MDTLLDTDGPVLFSVNGKTLSFPKATNRDYLPWLAKLHEQTKAAKMKLVPITMPPAEKFKLYVMIDKEVPTQWDLIGLLNTPAGIDEVLAIVCSKLSKEDHDAVMALAQVRQYELAARASGLIPASRLAAMFGPTQAELEQHALNLLYPFWQSMKTKGVSDDVAKSILLDLPGVTGEMIDGKPSTPEAPKAVETFGELPNVSAPK